MEVVSNGSVEAGFYGFSGFSEQKLFQFQSGTAAVFTFNTAYSGLVLLRFATGQTYPVYIGGDNFSMGISKPVTPPEFENSPENKWLYGWLARYRQLQKEKHLLQDNFAKTGADEGFIKQTEIALKRIDEKLVSKITELDNIAWPGLKSILQARLLNESSYNIKTKSDLETKKKEYGQFVNDNLQYLYYSDMLMGLFRQYLMMNEYVGFTKKGFVQQINTDVEVLANMLPGRIDKEETVRFVMEVFYGRGMVTIASHIMDKHCARSNGDGTANTMSKTGDTIEDMYIGNANQGSGWHLSQNKGFKILSVVGKNEE